MGRGLRARAMRVEMELYIKDFIHNHDSPPSLYEIADRFGINVGTARFHVLKLAKAGRIHYTPRINRGIRLVYDRGNQGKNRTT